MRAYSITATAVIAALTLGLNACGDSESPVGADQKSDAESLTDGDGSGAPSLDRDNGAMDGALTARDGDLPTTDQGIPTAEIVTVADLLEHLRATGATAEETGDTVEQPFFTPAGQVLEISDQDVQAFVYDTVEQLKSEARQVMPDGSVIGTTSIRWAAPPRFYATGHLIVLYVGQDRELAGALDRVMGSPFAGDSAGAIVIDPLPPAGPDDQVDERRAPAIVVATSEADIKQLALFTEEPAADELLMDVDLEENAVVAVFRGEMRTAGYDIDIEAVEISGGVAEITVNLTNPAPDMPVATVLTYPVAVHVVPRADIPDAAALDWVAVTDDGEVLARLWPGAVSSGQVEGSSGAIISDGLPIAPTTTWTELPSRPRSTAMGNRRRPPFSSTPTFGAALRAWWPWNPTMAWWHRSWWRVRSRTIRVSIEPR